MDSVETVPPNDVPRVFHAVLKCLELESGPVSWTLSKSFDGKFELRIRNFPAPKPTGKCPDVLDVKEVESTTRPISTTTTTKTTGKKKKSPSRIKRDRERRRLWRRKQRAARQNSVSDEPESVVTVEHQVCDSGNATDQDLPSRAASGDLPEHSPSFDVVPEKSNPVTNDSTSVVDSDDKCEPNVPISKFPPDVCVSCGETEGRFFTCSKCKAVKYCGVKCQKDNWSEHKRACSTLKDLDLRGKLKQP